MRANEFITDINEDIPNFAKGIVGGAALAGMGLVGSQLHKQPTQPASLSVELPDATKEIVKQPTVNKDQKVLAQTIWGEARQDGIKGMMAVANVIKNRAEENKKMFGQGIIGVAQKPNQFSCWNKNDPNYKKLQEIVKIDNYIKNKISPVGGSFVDWFNKFKNTGRYIDYKAYVAANEIADKVLNGKVKDITKGATYYHTTDIKPYWTKKLEKTAKVGDHVFYDLPDNVSEYKVDNVDGLGSVPLNANVDYRGLRVLMRPSIFLSLAAHLAEPGSVDYIVQHIENGGSLGAPFLQVDIPEKYFKKDFTGLNFAKVIGHEGRNRMLAIKKVEGDDPVEVHIFPLGEIRARHLNKDVIEQLEVVMRSQDGKLVFAPRGDLLFEPINT